jgi:hypothetical protein
MLSKAKSLELKGKYTFAFDAYEKVLKETDMPLPDKITALKRLVWTSMKLGRYTSVADYLDLLIDAYEGKQFHQCYFGRLLVLSYLLNHKVVDASDILTELALIILENPSSPFLYPLKEVIKIWMDETLTRKSKIAILDSLFNDLLFAKDPLHLWIFRLLKTRV